MLENRTTGGPPFAWGPSKPRRLDTTIAWGLIRLHPFILDKSGKIYMIGKWLVSRPMSFNRLMSFKLTHDLTHDPVLRIRYNNRPDEPCFVPPQLPRFALAQPLPAVSGAQRRDRAQGPSVRGEYRRPL